MSITQGISDYVARRMGKWRSVLRFISSECDAPMMVYLETLPGALVDPLLTLLDFGWDDVARGALRPKGVYSCRRAKKRKSKWSKYGIPELGEEIGKRIPGAEQLKSRRVGSLERSLWLIDGAIQRALYWLMIADLVTDFAYGWVSAIRERGYCRQATVPRIAQQGRVFRANYPLEWFLVQAATPLWSQTWAMAVEQDTAVDYVRTSGSPAPTLLIIAITIDAPASQYYGPSVVQVTVAAYTGTGLVHLSTHPMSITPGEKRQHTIRLDLPPCTLIRLSPPITHPWQPPVSIFTYLTQDAVWLVDR